MPRRSSVSLVNVKDAHLLECGTQFANLHVLAEDLDHADASGVDWLCALFFALEADLVSAAELDLLRGLLGADLLQVVQIDLFGVAEQSDYEAVADEDDSLALLLQLLAVLWQERDVAGAIRLVGPDVASLALGVLE